MAVRITSSQYPGQQCSVVLYSPTGNTIPYTNATSTNLGTKTLPFTYAGDDEYGVFEITINSNQAPCTGVAKTPPDGDGNTYKIIKIGAQTWMSENLKTFRSINGTLLSNTSPVSDTDWQLADGDSTRYWAYPGSLNGSGNVSTYGLLYNRYALMGTTPDRQLCPTNYRMPTDAEFNTLNVFLGGISGGGGGGVGTKLKSPNLWLFDSGVPTGTNTTGFNALPAGLRNSNAQYFSYFTRNLYLWTSESVNWGVAWNNDEFNRRVDLNEKYGMSVRCILDTGGSL